MDKDEETDNLDRQISDMEVEIRELEADLKIANNNYRKYRQMWEEYKRKNGHYLIGIKEDERLRVGYTIGDFMAILKQKYFPKEASQDEE